jgi:hypothetical protein
MWVSSQRALVVVGFAVHVHELVLAVAFAVRYVALAVDHRGDRVSAGYLIFGASDETAGRGLVIPNARSTL